MKDLTRATADKGDARGPRPNRGPPKAKNHGHCEKLAKEKTRKRAKADANRVLAHDDTDDDEDPFA